MIGDHSWYDLLWERYRQHCADSARAGREPAVYERWAVEATWTDFVRLARLVLALPPFALDDWETANPIPMVSRNAPRSTVLARRLIDALVMVQQLLKNMGEADRPVASAVKRYIRDGHRSPTRLAVGKRYVYDWLMAAAKRDLGNGSNPSLLTTMANVLESVR